MPQSLSFETVLTLPIFFSIIFSIILSFAFFGFKLFKKSELISFASSSISTYGKFDLLEGGSITFKILKLYF